MSSIKYGDKEIKLEPLGGSQFITARQGTANAGKTLRVGEDGNITLSASLHEVDILLGGEDGSDASSALLHEVDTLLGED